MSHLIRNLALSICFCPLPLAAQDGASTLDQLVQRADVVSRVRVVAVKRDDRGQTEVLLQSLEDLKGKSPARIQLREPGARSCGRALWGLVPGTGLIAFLETEDSSVRLCVSSARSLAAIEPGLLDHLREMIRAGGAKDRIDLLVAGLDSPSHRVREDSALALPQMPQVTDIGPEGEALILATLRESLANEDRRLLGLMLLAARMNLENSASFLLDAYLDPHMEGYDRVFQRVLPALSTGQVLQEIQERYRSDRSSGEKILPLLESLETRAVRPLLLEMLEDPQRSVSLAAGSSLLTRGMPEGELSEHLTAAELEICRQRRQARRPVFRAILQRRSADEMDRE
ncbi:MAG: hypothetical protein ACYTG5_14910 [Planctomycetota bacterium]|jgi:hypothetical protein